MASNLSAIAALLQQVSFNVSGLTQTVLYLMKEKALRLGTPSQCRGVETAMIGHRAFVQSQRGAAGQIQQLLYVRFPHIVALTW